MALTLNFNIGHGFEMPKIVTWADGTDEEIAAMVKAADEGIINLSDYWTIGDSRNITFSALPTAYSVDTRHAPTTQPIVLMDTNHFELSETSKKCNFVVGFKDPLGYGSWTPKNNLTSYTFGKGWQDCNVREWCNNSLYNSIPEGIKSIFKKFKNGSASGTNGARVIVEDYFALFSEIEVFGVRTWASANGVSGDTHIEYFKTESNRHLITTSYPYNGAVRLRSDYLGESPHGECSGGHTYTPPITESGGAPCRYYYAIRPFGCI